MLQTLTHQRKSDPRKNPPLPFNPIHPSNRPSINMTLTFIFSLSLSLSQGMLDQLFPVEDILMQLQHGSIKEVR